MTERLPDIYGVEVYVTKFLDEEKELGQIKAQGKAVSRLISRVFGDNARIEHRPDGSPVIIGSSREISISHCTGMAALAVGKSQRIGIDIELPRPTLRRVADKFISATEFDRWGADDTMLLKAWTIKEALYKAAGQRGVNFADDVKLPEDPESTQGVGTVTGIDKKDTHYALHSAYYGKGCLTLAVPIDGTTP